MFVGELACGTLSKRGEILNMLKALPQGLLLGHEEVLSFLEARHVYGRGLGWVDVYLLASTLLTPCTLWTFDKALRRADSSRYPAIAVNPWIGEFGHTRMGCFEGLSNLMIVCVFR